MKKVISLLLIAVLVSGIVCLAGCSAKKEETKEVTQALTASTEGIDYLVVVNKLHKLPKDWEQKLQITKMNNSLGDDVEVESKAYEAYLKLKEALAKEGVNIDLDSARRSVAAQEDIVKRFTKKYGEDYVKKYVAVPGYSEHHTGLALDLYLNIDGKDVYLNEDMVKYPEIWEKIHQKIADYGFILRYLKGKEHVTGYSYEPWHIRYIDDADAAKEITTKGIAFEEYLGLVKVTDVAYDYGQSKLYKKAQIEECMDLVKCKFAEWEGCELQALRYAGDEKNAREKVERLKSLNEKEPDQYTAIMVLETDFKTGEKISDTLTLEPGKDYTDYQWILACDKDGSWEIVDAGY